MQRYHLQSRRIWHESRSQYSWQWRSHLLELRLVLASCCLPHCRVIELSASLVALHAPWYAGPGAMLITHTIESRSFLIPLVLFEAWELFEIWRW